MPILLSNASATGAGVTWEGGRGVFSASATWSGATVSLQAVGPDGTTFIPVSGAPARTADGCVEFVHPPGKLRAAVTGGPPSAVYARVDLVRNA